MAALIRRATVFNGSAPGVDTDILASAISPSKGCVSARICVALTTSSNVVVTATDGSTTHKWDINFGAALAAATDYLFVIGTNPALSYNVQVAVDGVIEQLLWDDMVELV